MDLLLLDSNNQEIQRVINKSYENFNFYIEKYYVKKSNKNYSQTLFPKEFISLLDSKYYQVLHLRNSDSFLIEDLKESKISYSRFLGMKICNVDEITLESIISQQMLHKLRDVAIIYDIVITGETKAIITELLTPLEVYFNEIPLNRVEETIKRLWYEGWYCLDFRLTDLYVDILGNIKISNISCLRALPDNIDLFIRRKLEFLGKEKSDKLKKLGWDKDYRVTLYGPNLL